MATYRQWHDHAAKGEHKRVTWVCGAERLLVEEVVDTTREYVGPADVDYAVLDSTSSERSVWAAANQYPVAPSANRLVVVRSAQRLKRWAALREWFEGQRFAPTVHLLFISDDPDLDTTQEHQALIRDKGRLVRCAPLNEKDAIDWVIRRSEVSRATALYLLQRVGGDLTVASAVLGKVELFSGPPTKEVLAVLCEEAPSDGFVESLCRMDRHRALRAASSVAAVDYSRIVGLLDSRLDVLAKLHTAVVRRQPLHEVKGVHAFVARSLAGAAKFYDVGRVEHCRAVLALVDDAVRSGARDGVLEAVAALW